MKTISKTFKTSKEAVSYQNRLYNKYDYVRLVKSPVFQEYGIYTWAVK